MPLMKRKSSRRCSKSHPKTKEEIDKAETDAAVEAKKDEAVGKDGAKDFNR